MFLAGAALSIKDGADHFRKLYDPDARGEVGDLDGRLLQLDGACHNYALWPADRFMPD